MSSAEIVEELPWHLRGNFGPVKEERTEFNLQVSGAVPPELDGLYIRNGSNPKGTATSHWFFGDGMVHGVRLEQGKAVWYRNRWVETPKLAGDLDSMDPQVIMDRTASAANTSVIRHAGRILALEEGHFPFELSPELETIGCRDFDGKLQTAFTAHPKLCPETNELHFFGYGPIAPYLVYHVLDAKGDLVHTAEIEVPGPTMMHDFIITRDHAIFMDLPVTFNLERAMSGGSPIGWDESYGARIGIMPRMGTNADIRWFEIDPCYVFHPMNAFVDPHDSNKVVCNVGRHEYMWRDSMDDFPPSYLHRWTFDMVTGAVTETQLDDVAHGFPRVDERRVGLPNRYGWVVAERPGGEGRIDDPSVVVKYDLEKGTSSSHDLGRHAHPGEFVFAPGSESAGEDEGFVMGFVYDHSSDSSDLVILDASNMKAPPVARIHLPQRVPFGFHGSWLPTS